MVASRSRYIIASSLVVLFAVGAMTANQQVLGKDAVAGAKTSNESPVEAPKPTRPLHEQIDRLIAAKTDDYAKLAAPISSDAEFIRRISLDLTGVIPTANETRTFLADANPNKRGALIDRLLAGPEYARHMQRVFDVILMRRLPAKSVAVDQWETFLRTSFAENRSWDQITREILSGDGVDEAKRGAARFFLDRDGDVNHITRDVGTIFLGANLECAQCHNHPEIEDFKQEDYYGISAFLVRSFLFKDKKKKVFYAEKAEGEVSFESVFDIRDKTSKGPRSTPPKIFDGVAIKEPTFKKAEAYKVKPAKNVRPIPKFSRRAKLADAITSPANKRFARTSGNRLWAILFGRGLVHPVEYDHRGNPPSHPELLDRLAEQLTEHDYDVKWFLRQLVLTQTYQRSSRRDLSSPESSIPAENLFAQAILKPLSPAQFAWAVVEATGEAGVVRKNLGDKLNEQTLFQKLAGYEKTFTGQFSGVPGKPPVGFESTVAQVLFLANDATIQNLIKRKNGNLADRLANIPADNVNKIANELYISVLSRPPAEEEIKETADYLKGQTGDPRTRAIEELIWALITSSEFRFNH